MKNLSDYSTFLVIFCLSTFMGKRQGARETSVECGDFLLFASPEPFSLFSGCLTPAKAAGARAPAAPGWGGHPATPGRRCAPAAPPCPGSPREMLRPGSEVKLLGYAPGWEETQG